MSLQVWPVAKTRLSDEGYTEFDGEVFWALYDPKREKIALWGTREEVLRAHAKSAAEAAYSSLASQIPASPDDIDPRWYEKIAHKRIPVDDTHVVRVDGLRRLLVEDDPSARYRR